MNRQQILALIRRPQSINAQQLRQLEQLLGRYPYFQGAHTLAARGKYNIGRPDARKNITLASLYATDKQRFKEFMSKKAKSVEAKPPGRYNPSKPQPVRKSIPPPPQPKSPTYVAKTLPEAEREKLVGEIMSELGSLRHNMQQFEHRADAQEPVRHYVDPQAAQQNISEESKSSQSPSVESPPSTEEKHKLEEEKYKLKEERRKLEEEKRKLEEERQLSSKETSRSISTERKEVEIGSLAQQPFPPPPVQVFFGNNPYPFQYPYNQNMSYNPPPVYPSFGGYTLPFMPPPALPPFSSAYPYVSPMYSLLSPVHPYGSPFPPASSTPASLQAQVPVQPTSSPPMGQSSASSLSPPSVPGQTQSHQHRTPSSSPQSEQKSIIERFIQNVSGEDASLSSDDLKKNSSDTLAYSSDISDSICSEELAELYRNQGHDARAIEIYHRLCEKYPEKSAYFVSRIREIKK